MGSTVSRLEGASVDQLYDALGKRMTVLCKSGRIDQMDEQTLRCILAFYRDRHKLSVKDPKSLSKAQLCGALKDLFVKKPPPQSVTLDFYDKQGQYLFDFTTQMPRQLTTGQLYRRVATWLTQETGKGVATFDITIQTAGEQILPEEEDVLLIPSPWFKSIKDLRSKSQFTVGRVKR